MKTKLLVILIAMLGLASCGSDDTTTSPDINNRFVVKMLPEGDKYVNEYVNFVATLDNVDVTKDTKFTVNGEELKDTYYLPTKEGTFNVVAKMEGFEYSFKFDAINKVVDPTPEKGNRIEYNGEVYSLAQSEWNLILDGNDIYTVDDGKSILWYMLTYSVDDNDEIKDALVTIVKVPYGGDRRVVLPYAAGSEISLYEGGFIINGEYIKSDMIKSEFSFASQGNTFNTQTKKGTANYTCEINLENSNKLNMYWNGEFSHVLIDITDVIEPVAKLIKK